MKRRRVNHDSIPEKANRILNGILVVLLLILFRIWHVAIVQHEEKKVEAKRPQERVVVEKAERATICDRFGIPLAINKVQYNASICYGRIRELPRTIWEKNADGKRIKHNFRKEYITRLSEKLGEELHIEPQRIEDLVHSKAAVLGNVPFILKEDISETTYFRLKMLEKDWPGIEAEIAAKRCYPQGPIGGEVVGYIGPISAGEYKAITGELEELNICISQWEEGEQLPFPKGFQTIEEVKARLDELEKKAYSINDFVGKMGVEAAFDEELRGLRGRYIYLSDARGNYLRELEGSEPSTPGEQVRLSISIELQAYAEQLLAEYENLPAAIKQKEFIPNNQPWIKGGAVVALDPLTGEIYTLASFPRFDPNDFVRKKGRVNQWLENEEYLAGLWDLKYPLVRERFDPLMEMYYEEQIELDWDAYLNSLLPENSPILQILGEKGRVADALFVQKKVGELLALFSSSTLTPPKIFDYLYSEERSAIGVTLTLPEREFLNEKKLSCQKEIEQLIGLLSPYFQKLPLNYEKLLLVDLYRLAVDEKSFSPQLAQCFGELLLSDYRELSARFAAVEQGVREIVYAQYLEGDFKTWRANTFPAFLKEKREAEKKEGKKYARPYIEYLDEIQKAYFQAFWEENRWKFIALLLTGEEKEGPCIYAALLKNWAKELDQGAHSGLSWAFAYKRLKDLIANIPLFIPLFKTIRSFSSLDRPLFGKYHGLSGPLEKHLASAFYPTYGYGFARSHAFRQATTIGSIFKLVPAYEALRQRYLKNKEDLNPLTIIDDKQKTQVGYTLDGKAIPLYYHGGRLPRSDHAGMGRVDLVKAIERSSNPYFALLAGEILDDPEDLCKAAAVMGFGSKTGIALPGEYGGRIPQDVAYNRTGLYSMAIGQHTLVGTPLQTAVMLGALANGGEVLKPQITPSEKEMRWKFFLPEEVQKILIQGLKQVVVGEKGTARFLKLQRASSLVNQIIGKTSTAEVVKRYSWDGNAGRLKAKDIWFGGIAYESEDLKNPELVVIVYLKHGEWGNDAAPLMGKMVQKWREIKKRHESSTGR